MVTAGGHQFRPIRSRIGKSIVQSAMMLRFVYVRPREKMFNQNYFRDRRINGGSSETVSLEGSQQE